MNLQKSLFLLCMAQLSLATPTSHLHWDWNAINTDNIAFPNDFIWGFSSSGHQFEGNSTNNTWSKWEEGNFPDGTPHVKDRSGIACDHWNRYKEDIQLLKKTGAKSFKFSVEWSKIEPQEGVYDQAALTHYEDLCKELVNNGIKPVLTIHHYTDPLWFMNKGGFEKAENIRHYVEYSKKLFERLHPYVFLWITFTSPSAYATKGYLHGMVPPGKRDMQLMAEVLKNILEGHVQVYEALKPINPSSQIAFSKNIYQLEPWNYYNPIDRIASMIGNYITNKSIYNFFTTGIFKLYIPGKANVYHENKKAPKSLDFIALNYYSHAYMNFFNLMYHPEERKTQNPMYTLYPEGMYRAIKEIHKKISKPLGIPIYIVENGVATDDDAMRREQSQRYLYAISKAIKDGCDVRSYIHWALLDNYEWGCYSTKNYGAYKVDFTTQERTLKPGTDYLLGVIRTTTQNS